MGDRYIHTGLPHFLFSFPPRRSFRGSFSLSDCLQIQLFSIRTYSGSAISNFTPYQCFGSFCVTSMQATV